jgi:predicted ATPase
MDTNNRLKISRIKLSGFKSVDTGGQIIQFGDITILLGANGSGKSNLVSFFHMLNSMMGSALQTYIGKSGSAETLLYYGVKNTSGITAEIQFDNVESSTYQFTLTHAAGDTLILTDETISQEQEMGENQRLALASGTKESCLPAQSKDSKENTACAVFELLRNCRVFQFHDTSKEAKVRNSGYVHDNRFLHSDGGNLAAFLYFLRDTEHNKYYTRIIRYIQRAMPQFDDFDLRVSPLNQDYIILNWYEHRSEHLFGPHQISDGSLRFMALATLLLQPPDLLPTMIILDEPELGLHPSAISILAGMVKIASRNCQVLLATQSPRLVDEFDPGNILVVERNRAKRRSEFITLDEKKLADWLDRYSMSELWEKNVIGGQP